MTWDDLKPLLRGRDEHGAVVFSTTIGTKRVRIAAAAHEVQGATILAMDVVSAPRRGSPPAVRCDSQAC